MKIKLFMKGMNIKVKSFKAKLVTIFIVPSAAFLYLLYLFIYNEYFIQNKISQYHYATTVMVRLSNLVNTLQLERGLSSGYIVSKETKLKTELLKQCDTTDDLYKELLKVSSTSSFSKEINKKSRNIIFYTINLLKNIKDIRESVLDGSISFEQEIKYYSEINNLFILSIKNINSKFLILQNEDTTINNLLHIQEYAGLERAYIYNFLLSQDKLTQSLFSIKMFIKERKNAEKNLLLSASQDSLFVYNKLYKKEIEKRVYSCSKNIFDNDFTSLNAKECFYDTTQYINMLDDIYQNILKRYIKKTTIEYEYSIQYLHIVYIIAAISIFMIGVIFYLLSTLINREEKYKIDLQIAAYTFEAQEGVLITDGEGMILKVNSSFTTITGYQLSEVIGKTPRILKSDKHHEDFYKNLWNKLLVEGQWKGEIINKRKNGEYFNEMLSISSIKNKDGIITHYIGQFLDISEFREAQKALQHQIDYDFLSELLNRKALKQRLKEAYSKAKRHNLYYAFLFIDLDNFKNINDTYGHDIGDKLIVEVSKRMKTTLREEDVVARLSGDEFAVLVKNQTKEKKEIEFIATKLLNEIFKEMVLDNNTIQISSSIGIKIFPDKDTSLEDIIIHADKAMYKAKKQGKNQFVFYTA